jgi:predicted metal-binding protein
MQREVRRPPAKSRKRKGGGRPPSRAQKDLAHFVQLALDMGADAARIIDTGTITCEAWVRLKCQYGCPGYNKRLMCPPFTPTPAETAEVVACYRRAILLHANDNEVINDIIPRLEQKIFLAGYFKALGFGSGPCRICENRGSRCDTSKRCKYPVIARPAMEACGMNVFDTARSNGFHIEVVRSHRQIDDYFGVVLID